MWSCKLANTIIINVKLTVIFVDLLKKIWRSVGNTQ